MTRGWSRRRWLQWLLLAATVRARPSPPPLQQAIDTLTGGQPVKFHYGVGLSLPRRAQSRLAVPVRVDCRLAGTDLIALFVTPHPQPLAVRVNLAPSVRPFLRTHLRLNRDSEIVAVVRARGRYFRQSARIDVSRGCG